MAGLNFVYNIEKNGLVSVEYLGLKDKLVENT